MAKRWAVAGVGIPSVVGLLYLGGWALAVPVAALAALGALEVYHLARVRGVDALATPGALAAAGLVALAAWRPAYAAFTPTALGLVGATTVVSLLMAIRTRGPAARPLLAVSVTIFGALYAGLPLAFVMLLHALPEAAGWSGAAPAAWGGLLAVALPLGATWLGDAVALFAGSAWGKGGLAPTISPNKSWLGVWTGLAGAGVAGAVWLVLARGHLPELPVSGPLTAAVLGVLLGVGAVLGDLAESLLKREAGVKDSGALFPGHGGVLDRLDALIVTLPSAYVMLAVLDASS